MVVDSSSGPWDSNLDFSVLIIIRNLVRAFEVKTALTAVTSWAFYTEATRYAPYFYGSIILRSVLKESTQAQSQFYKYFISDKLYFELLSTTFMFSVSI
jgi:hypothetical protein